MFIQKYLQKSVILLFGLASCATAVTAAPTADDEIEAKVEAILSKMTLQEKIGQLNQLSPWDDNDLTGRVKAGQVGSILNYLDPAKVNKIQKVAMEESRMGIPLLIARDVIHGYKTIFPIPLGQAATFDPEIVEKGARIAAIEATADGIRWTFAPMIDISRDGRWGRIAESCGEDPYLTMVMGLAMIKGFQGKSLNDPTSMAACAKHYLGYGASEAGRDYNSTYIPERQMRNVYLPPFKVAAQAGCATFMTSFNDNDGVPSTANKHLLNDILRNEWKYDGMVVSDWTSVSEMITHGFAKDAKDAAEKSINAGVDMDMVSEAFIKNLEKSLSEGKVSMATIDNAVRNILRLKFRLGLFDNPYITTPQSVKYAPEHLAAAQKAVEESAILLENKNNTLPFSDKVRKVLVVGPMADAAYEQMGTWVFDGDKEHSVTPLNAIRKMYGDKVQVTYLPTLKYSRDKDASQIAKAVKAAKSADVVIAFVGEESILSGEAHSLADIKLQGAQSELIKQIGATNTPLVTVIMAGRQLVITEEAKASDALVYMFSPGTMAGPAIADILFGKVNPSGKTPVTFPRLLGQTPLYYAQNATGRPANENEMLIDEIPIEAGQTSVGCRSFYLDAGTSPLYPFGYGLSYTDFKYDNLSISAKEIGKDGTLTISVDLTNNGKCEGTEVVQLYVQDKVGSITRPVKELKGFKRVTLKAGETSKVTFTLPISSLEFYGLDNTYKVEPGDFRLWVGPDSQSGPSIEFTVTE